MTDYGIGITTYRDKKSENINKPVYMATKRGDVFGAAKKVNKYVRAVIDWSAVTDYKGYPVLGTYEGGQEPAAHVYFSLPGRVPVKLKTEFMRFKNRGSQDSILLYEFVRRNGAPVLEININSGQPIKEIQQEITKATNGKIGGYLTYIYSLHRLVIVNVKEFDDLTPAQFRKLIPQVKRAVKAYGGKVTVKQAKVTVI